MDNKKKKKKEPLKRPGVTRKLIHWTPEQRALPGQRYAAGLPAEHSPPVRLAYCTHALGEPLRHWEGAAALLSAGLRQGSHQEGPCQKTVQTPRRGRREGRQAQSRVLLRGQDPYSQMPPLSAAAAGGQPWSPVLCQPVTSHGTDLLVWAIAKGIKTWVYFTHLV